LLATGAGPAHAAGEWKIGSKTFAELKTEGELITASLTEPLTYTVPSFNFGITCKAVEVDEGNLQLEGAGSLKLLFSECMFFQVKPFEEMPICEVREFKINASPLVLLHGETKGKKRVFVLLKASTSALINYIVLSAGCPILFEHSVQGSLAIELGSESASQLWKLGVAEPESLLGDGLKQGINPATISGALSLSLSGPHKGQSWGGI
jgi:hypothetical protein